MTGRGEGTRALSHPAAGHQVRQGRLLSLPVILSPTEERPLLHGKKESGDRTRLRREEEGREDGVRGLHVCAGPAASAAQEALTCSNIPSQRSRKPALS